MVGDAVHGPAAFHIELRQFRLGRFEFIGKNRERDQRIGLEFTSNVISVLIEYYLAGWKCADKTNLH